MKNLLKIEWNPNRVYGLDILRALAILFVIIGHGQYYLTDNKVFGIKSFLGIIRFDGVTIFFVLSGFLIGGILIKTLENSKKGERKILLNFWKRRWYRTLPNYLLLLLLLLLLNTLFTKDFILLDKWKYFIFSQNLFYPHPKFFGEAWSLCIEEWFYLLIPPIILSFVFVFKYQPQKAVLITAMTVLLFVTLFRFYRFKTIGAVGWDACFHKQVITRLDSIMYGVIGAYLSFYHKNIWVKSKYILLLAGLFLFVLSKFRFGGSLNRFVFSFSTISVATLFLLPYLSELKKGTGVVYESFTKISLISYSMYLLNLSVIQCWIIDRIHWDGFIYNLYLIDITKYTFFWFLTIILSIFLYKYFELPMMNLRDKK